MQDIIYGILENKELLRYAGVVGAGMYITSYAILQLDYIKSTDFRYSILQGSAASLVLLSMLDAFNLSAFIIQVCFLSLSIIGILRRVYLERFDLYLKHRASLNALKPMNSGRVKGFK